MAEILRTWSCLNGRCGAAFDAWEANPACPACGCVRVSWVPGGGHIGKSAGAVDAEFRTLADNFGLSDLKSARRGEAAKPIAAQAVAPANQAPIQFAPGFAAVAHPERAVCVPSSQGVNFKARPTVGTALAPNRAVPGIGTNTRVEAVHRAKS